MKRTFLLLGVLLLISTTGSRIAYANVFSYWYSNASSISYFSKTALNWGVDKTAGCGMNTIDLGTYVNHGRTAWSLQGYSYTASSWSIADLKTVCITRTEADSLNIPSNAVGANALKDKTYVGDGEYNGQTKGIYSHTGYWTYYIWDTCGESNCPNTATFGATKWKNVAAHEHGHGIGYDGHGPTGQLMQPSVSSTITTPTTDDKRHMGNMYIFN